MPPTRGVHGNGEDWDPMGFPWEWEYDQPWDGNGMGMGIKCMGMGVKTWELSPATVNRNDRNAGGATARD